ncbi:MAG: mandelate racemase/muconate lactonizing enzyme family protein [Gammaproteobacteria bacterium]
MKIADYKVFAVANPRPYIGGPCWIFVQLITDGGVKGIGEIYGTPFRPPVVCQMAADVIERQMIGANPFRIEQMWRRAYSSAYTQKPDATLLAILSAVETAFWDIAGKELNRPVYDLLGGKVREQLRTYTYLYPQDGDAGYVEHCPQTAAARAAQYVGEGFGAVKFDPLGAYGAFDPRQLSMPVLRRAREVVAAVREAVGDKCDILIGTHGQMTPSAAARLARHLEEYDPLWLEEPVPPENPQAMAQVAKKTTIPIAAGERLATKHEFARLLEAGGAAIVQPQMGRCGGILEAKKIAAIAEAHYAQVAPHLYCGPIAGAAAVQLSACIPNFLILEGLYKWDGFSAEILTTPFEWQDGNLTIPTTPGIGAELNEEVAEKHKLKPNTPADKLHLTPAENPID